MSNNNPTTSSSPPPRWHRWTPIPSHSLAMDWRTRYLITQQRGDKNKNKYNITKDK